MVAVERVQLLKQLNIEYRIHREPIVAGVSVVTIFHHMEVEGCRSDSRFVKMGRHPWNHNRLEHHWDEEVEEYENGYYGGDCGMKGYRSYSCLGWKNYCL